MGKFKGMVDKAINVARASKAVATGDTEALSQAMINWLDKGIMPAGVIRPTIITEFDKTINKAKQAGIKEGKPATVDRVIESIENQPTFMRLCEKLGLTRELLVAEAKRILGGVK